MSTGLRAAAAFTVRRCQIVLASARGERASAIARGLGCGEQSVRNASQAFDAAGAYHSSGSSRLRTTHAAFDPDGSA